MNVSLDDQLRSETDVPIYSVICNMKNDSQANWLKRIQSQSSGQLPILVLQKSDFANFEKKILSKIDQIVSFPETEKLDIVVARLIALSSMEGSSALIHQKVASNEIVTTVKTQDQAKMLVNKQFNGLGTSETKQLYSETLTKRGENKVEVILWTKDQLAVITRMLDWLCNRSTGGQSKLRLQVYGPKGSGKLC